MRADWICDGCGCRTDLNGNVEAQQLRTRLTAAERERDEARRRRDDAGHTDVTGRPRACCCATEHGASLRARADRAEAALAEERAATSSMVRNEYEQTIGLVASYLGCNPTLANIEDAIVERDTELDTVRAQRDLAVAAMRNQHAADELKIERLTRERDAQNSRLKAALVDLAGTQGELVETRRVSAALTAMVDEHERALRKAVQSEYLQTCGRIGNVIGSYLDISDDPRLGDIEEAIERLGDERAAARSDLDAAVARAEKAEAEAATLRRERDEAREKALREAAGVCETEAQSLRSNGRHHAKSGDKQNAYDCIVEAQAIEAVRESILALLGEGVGS